MDCSGVWKLQPESESLEGFFKLLETPYCPLSEAEESPSLRLPLRRALGNASLAQCRQTLTDLSWEVERMKMKGNTREIRPPTL